MKTYCIAQGTLLRALCSNLNGKEIQKRGGTCTHIADSFCCTTETNTTVVKQLQSNKK